MIEATAEEAKIEKKVNKVHQKVANALGMAMDDPVEEDDLIPMPESTDIVVVENSELPELIDEMTRIEHTRRQVDFVIDHALPVIEQSFAKSMTMPPIYQARSIEANAKMLEAIKNMMQLKAEIEFKMIESKMKQAAFAGKKDAAPTISGNTFVFNREELMKARDEMLKSGAIQEAQVNENP